MISCSLKSSLAIAVALIICGANAQDAIQPNKIYTSNITGNKYIMVKPKRATNNASSACIDEGYELAGGSAGDVEDVVASVASLDTGGNGIKIWHKGSTLDCFAKKTVVTSLASLTDDSDCKNAFCKVVNGTTTQLATTTVLTTTPLSTATTTGPKTSATSATAKQATSVVATGTNALPTASPIATAPSTTTVSGPIAPTTNLLTSILTAAQATSTATPSAATSTMSSSITSGSSMTSSTTAVTSTTTSTTTSSASLSSTTRASASASPTTSTPGTLPTPTPALRSIATTSTLPTPTSTLYTMVTSRTSSPTVAPVTTSVSTVLPYGSISMTSLTTEPSIMTRPVATVVPLTTESVSAKPVTSEPTLSEPKWTPMQIAVTIIQNIGCTWIIVMLAVVLAAMILSRAFHYERVLYGLEELTLLIAHIFVLTMRDAMTAKPLCQFASANMHFWFTAHFFFLSYDSVHGFLVTTGVINGALLRKPVLAAVGFGISGVITCIGLAAWMSHYPSEFLCFVNYGHKLGILIVTPISVLFGLGLIFVDTANTTGINRMPLVKKRRFASILWNQAYLTPLLCVGYAHWLLSSIALHYVRMELTLAVFGLTLALGVLYVFRAMATSAAMRAWLERLIRRVCPKRAANKPVGKQNGNAGRQPNRRRSFSRHPLTRFEEFNSSSSLDMVAPEWSLDIRAQ